MLSTRRQPGSDPRLYRDLGATVAEFPMHDRVFLAARDAGDPIVLGARMPCGAAAIWAAPVLRAMIARGLCDILASGLLLPRHAGRDGPPERRPRRPLAALWKLVSLNRPARWA